MSNSYNLSQKDLPIKLQILNISVNMARIANLVESNKSAILMHKFMDQTDKYLADLSEKDVSRTFIPTLRRFKQEFKRLKNQKVDEKNKDLWCERALTWADILQIRANLA